MPALPFILTNAGKAAIINANNTGTNPITIAKIGIGSASWTPTAAATALNTEIKKITTISGAVVADDTIHVTASDDSTDVYTVREIGLFTASDVLVAVYAQADPIITKGAATVALIATDLVITGIPAGSVTVGDAGFSYPQATETVKGVAEIATASEVIAGTDNERIVSPQGLAALTANSSRRGLIEIALASEVQGGADTDRAVTPSTLNACTATETRRGVLEIATTAEAQTGTDDERAITPAKLQSVTATGTRRGVIELATSEETRDGSDNERAVTPQSLASLFSFYGMPTASLLTEGSNLNDVTRTGFYRGTTGAYTNKPVNPDTGASNYDFEMMHIQSSSSEATQIVFAQSVDDLCFFRQKSTGSWQTWKAFVFLGRDATTTQQGLIELATVAEVQAGSDSVRAVTPSTLNACTATTSRTGVIALATEAEVQAGTNAFRAVTPATLNACSATTTRSGVIEIATQAETNTGTDGTRAVTPNTLRLYPGTARAWVNFDGDGAIVINNSHGVSSVTDLGVGLYQINWDGVFGSSNYAWVGTARMSSDGSTDHAVVSALASQTKSTSALRIRVSFDDGGVQDSPEISVVAFA